MSNLATAVSKTFCMLSQTLL